MEIHSVWAEALQSWYIKLQAATGGADSPLTSTVTWDLRCFYFSFCTKNHGNINKLAMLYLL